MLPFSKKIFCLPISCLALQSFNKYKAVIFVVVNCVVLGRSDKCVQNFCQKTWREETIFINLGVDWRMILKSVFHKSDGISWVSELPFAPQELCAA
jgi:hypothetical protein